MGILSVAAITSLVGYIAKIKTLNLLKDTLSWFLRNAKQVYVNFKVWIVGMHADHYSEYLASVIPVMRECEDSMDAVVSRVDDLTDKICDMEQCIEQVSQKSKKMKIKDGMRQQFEDALEMRLRLKHWNPDANKVNEAAIMFSSGLICRDLNLIQSESDLCTFRVVPKVFTPDQTTFDAVAVIYNSEGMRRRLATTMRRAQEDNPFRSK